MHYLPTYTPCENSDQPAHLRSLIRIFTGHVLIASDATIPCADKEDSDQAVRMRRLSESSLGARVRLYVFLRFLSYYSG